jgi:hypothetical protein
MVLFRGKAEPEGILQLNDGLFFLPAVIQSFPKGPLRADGQRNIMVLFEQVMSLPVERDHAAAVTQIFLHPAKIIDQDSLF